MITNDDTTLLVLNELLIANKDAEQGYSAAADAVHEAELVELFEGYALQRGKYVQELLERIRTLRGTPATSGSPLGALHRGWMNFKASHDANETHTLLAECERGEDMALKAYASALKQSDLDAISRTLIQNQYEQVQAAHDRVRQLRDSSTYAHR